MKKPNAMGRMTQETASYLMKYDRTLGRLRFAEAEAELRNGMKCKKFSQSRLNVQIKQQVADAIGCRRGGIERKRCWMLVASAKLNNRCCRCQTMPKHRSTAGYEVR